MKNPLYIKGVALCLSTLVLLFPLLTNAQPGNPGGKVSQKIAAFKETGSFAKETALFSVAVTANRATENEVAKLTSRFTLLDVNSVSEILQTKPGFLSFVVPFENGSKTFRILLYKEDISPNGFNLITSDGKLNPAVDNIVHYRGIIDNDARSIVAFSFSQNNVAGLISNSNGNYILGKMGDNSGKHIIYNDKDLFEKPVFDCGTNTSIPSGPGTILKGTEATASLTAKCVNWYWETDYDLFVSKGSVANVNTYMQGIFNQVSTLYANDGISITLKTLFIWSTTDPYTGPGTSDFLTQFGVNRTSFDGDLANLIGTKGSGGVAWVNQLCNSQTKYKMAYSGISSSFNTVPSYSWTVEVITHEEGHLLGSKHTHDCVWNGNNTKIDGCGDSAGYPSGSCAIPSPALPAGGGTIMSYCHLTNAGINFNLGFGPQPTALIISKINAASCLVNCTTGCTVADQPGTITGNATACSGTSQTYSVTAVPGATGYIWSLPSGWTGSSTTNSITVTTGTTSGNVSITASNSCGNSTPRTFAVTLSTVPAQPGNVSGNTAVCSGTSQTYSVTAVQGATSYTWTLPAGWSGSSTTNSINVTTGAAGGTITVKANNSCGSSSTRTLTASITAASPAQPGSISGPASACQGSVQTYSVPIVSGVTGYNWTLPSGWSGSSTTNSIAVTAGNTAGNISVSAVNGCGTSTSRSSTVGISSLPGAAGTISVSGGTATVCTGNTRTYSVPLVNGITYNWVAPAGANINSGQGTNSISVGFTAAFSSPGTLTVTPSNSCGNGAPGSITISKAVIAKPGGISVSGGIAKVCPGDSRTYTVPGIAGITYNWTAPAGGVINSGQGTSGINISYNSNFTATGTLSVTANNACGTSVARTITLVRNNPSSSAAIAGPVTVCAGSTATYTATVVAAATSYIWTLPTGASIQGASNGNVVTILWGTRGGTLAVKAANACGNSGSRSLGVTVGCTSGTEESKNITTAEIFPNPTNDIANVRFSSYDNSMFMLTITDIAGKKLMSEKHPAVKGLNVHSFSLAKLSRGTYFVLIESMNAKKVLKISVQ